MILQELDNGLLEGIPEADDERINLEMFDKIIKSLAKNSPQMIAGLLKQGFKSLSPEESRILQDRIANLLEQM